MYSDVVAISHAFSVIVADALKQCASADAMDKLPAPLAAVLGPRLWNALSAKARHWVKRRAASYRPLKLMNKVVTISLINAQKQLNKLGMGHFDLDTLLGCIQHLLPEPGDARLGGSKICLDWDGEWVPQARRDTAPLAPRWRAESTGMRVVCTVVWRMESAVGGCSGHSLV